MKTVNSKYLCPRRRQQARPEQPRPTPAHTATAQKDEIEKVEHFELLALPAHGAKAYIGA
jgi:hypothetical protein